MNINNVVWKKSNKLFLKMETQMRNCIHEKIFFKNVKDKQNCSSVWMILKIFQICVIYIQTLLNQWVVWRIQSGKTPIGIYGERKISNLSDQEP